MPLPEAMIRRAIRLPAAESTRPEPVDFPARAPFFGSAMPWPRVSRHRRRVKPR
jgi:hypothetical protein